MSLPRGTGRERFPAMGTTVEVLLPAPRLRAGVDVVRALFAEWEACLSRFLPESELSELNRRAGAPVVVSPLLLGVLRTALEAAHASDGLYDPTLLRQIVVAGYDRSFDLLPTALPASLGRPEPGGGWRSVRVDAATRTVTLPAGVGVDFGGIAKGMAVDAALERLRALGIGAALVNAGGDLAVLGLPPDLDAWPIAAPGRDEAWTIPLARGAMATSGIARRRWRQGARERHHLLDPRTGDSAWTDLWSVTVVADRCAQAEVAAKVAFILGRAEGARWLRARQLAGLLVAQDGEWTATGAWPLAAMEVRP